MGIDVDIDEICDFIDLDDNDDITESSNNTIQHQQPVINIINSNVTIGNNNNTTFSDNVIYDNNDEYEFIFEEPGGEFGAPSAGADDDLDFGNIIEI